MLFYAYYYLGQKDKAIEILNTILDKDKRGIVMMLHVFTL